MNTEIEVKFLSVDHDDVRDRMSKLGGIRIQAMRQMSRAIIENEALTTGKHAFVRVRDEGDRVTMTYKQFDELSLHGAKEIEVTVSDFQATVDILSLAGLEPRSLQESRRETWQLGDVEVVLDEWPWLKPYIEIEGGSEEAVRDVALRLGFDWDSQAVFGDVMAAYRAEYPHLKIGETVASLQAVRFEDPLPDLLKPKSN